jgi:hypothetical protein
MKGVWNCLGILLVGHILGTARLVLTTRNPS